MNVIENIEMTELLKKAGYTIISETACTVTVADPVQCSNGGGKRWTEHKPVTMRSSAQVRRFMADRE